MRDMSLLTINTKKDCAGLNFLSISYNPYPWQTKHRSLFGLNLELEGYTTDLRIELFFRHFLIRLTRIK